MVVVDADLQEHFPDQMTMKVSQLVSSDPADDSRTCGTGSAQQCWCVASSGFMQPSELIQETSELLCVRVS